MKRLLLLPIVFVFLLFQSKAVLSQDIPIHPSYIGAGIFHGETPPLRDIPAITYEEYQVMVAKAHKRFLNPKLQFRSYPYADKALPKGHDEAWQKTMGNADIPKAPVVNFSGQTSPYFPSDCNGTAGPNHFMQTINCVYAIYSKTGALLAGPTNMNTLFSGVTGSNYNDGDPLVLYDEQAQRWLAVEFSISGSNDYMLVAVSTTSDPTGTWYKYSFDVNDMPDYEKFGIWQDGYYMGDNNSSSNDIYVFQRSVMLNGGASPAMIGFNNPFRPSSVDGFMCVPPLDNDGPAAPAGSPGIFISMNDDAIGGGNDQLWIYELAANWNTPSSSTFARVQQLNVTPFDSNFGYTWDNITQPGTTQKLDAIPMVIMNVPQYRNFGTYQTIVCCHTVDVDGTNHAGIRWYELRRGTQTSGNWAIRQQGTYAPDASSRWMGSVMLNGSGQIGLGYSISSSTIYPGIRYTGQSSSAYNNATGVMDIPEDIIQTATSSQSSYNRWGDYSLLSVDPTDDKTFWFTTQYGGSRQTKIASFKFGNAPSVSTLAATNVTAVAATLNGTVNPNGLATTYYFQWGLNTNYGNTTTTGSAGSGTVNVNVNAKISGLASGIPVHFRLVAVNSDGTANGNDMTLTPGAAVVTTTAASSITETGAIAGGNVISDGGIEVSARGLCWSTSANPTITGNHTNDGSGLGVFVSTLSGLTSNTTFHIRAYATNAGGTYYGDDLSFTTLCGVISSFPWSEGFENAGIIPNCWTQEQVNSSGLDWTFITGNGSGNPATAHSGTFNACLKDNTTTDNKTRLITPPINLSSVTDPTLTFWHTQAQGTSSSRQDQLYVYYKTSASGTWTLLASYTTSITTWTQRTISLPNASSEYYINFEGNAKRGRGVCIDDVSISGTVPTLSVSPSNQSVSSSAGSTAFNVTSNSGWTAISNQAWCAVTPTGTGNGVINANYQQNTSMTQRVAQITVTVNGLTPIVVTVTQAGATPTLAVAPANQDVSAAAGSTTFNVTSNTNWSVGSNQNWCTVTPTGTGNGIISANYLENTSISPRVAQITVTVNGLTPIVVTVNQAGATPTLAVEPANQDVSAAAGSTTFNVTSNTNWSVGSDQTWCTATPTGTGNGIISANYLENTSVSPRVAQITVTVNGLTPVVVTVSQTGATPTLAVEPANQDVSAAAGGTIYNVTSNTDWTVGSDQTWCTATPTGTGNGIISANYLENTSLVSRIATLTVTVSGLTPVEVTVSQEGVPCVDPTAYAGTDNTICENSSYPITDATAENYGGLLWTTSGSGSFDNPISLNPIYSPGAGDYGTTVILTLTVQPISPCINSATGNMQLFVQLLPAVYAGDDVTILDYVNVQLSADASDFLSLLWTSSGDGYFEDDGSANTVYHPGPADIDNSTVELSLLAESVSPCIQQQSDALTLIIMRQHTIEFPAGWSGFSSFVVPLNPEFSALMNPVFDNLEVAKTLTQVYWPEYGVNTIGNFDVHQGYFVKMTTPASLAIVGFKSQDRTINLTVGWNIMSVISDQEVSYQALIDQIGDNLIIVTEIAGSQILWPSAGIYSLTALLPGKAYLIKVSGNCSFTFPD